MGSVYYSQLLIADPLQINPVLNCHDPAQRVTHLTKQCMKLRRARSSRLSLRLEVFSQLRSLKFYLRVYCMKFTSGVQGVEGSLVLACRDFERLK